jgi:hypothetical protein
MPKPIVKPKPGSDFGMNVSWGGKRLALRATGGPAVVMAATVGIAFLTAVVMILLKVVH